MSSPRLRLAFARQAERDLRNILAHSLEQWGPEQRDRYAAAFEGGFRTLLEHPNLGRSRDDIHPGYRFYPVEQHVVCYQVTPRTIRIIRVLHQRMDLRRVFS